MDLALSLIEEHKALVLERLHAVESAAQRFGQTIRSSALPSKNLVPIRPIIVFEDKSASKDLDAEHTAADYRALNANASRLAAADAFCQFEYESADQKNQSPKCFGVVGTPAYVIEQAQQLNHLKDDLKGALQPISNLRVQFSRPDQQNPSFSKFTEVSTLLLRQTGRSSTNLLAMYRHIPIINEPVHAIRFMMTNTRSVPKISVADLRLKAHDRTDVLDALSNAPGITQNEYLLAPKKRYLRMRAKILLQQMQSPDSKRRMQHILSAELPILFPMLKADSRWPDVKGPGAPSQKKSPPPSRLEEEPLVTIGTQAYFRLKPEFRMTP
ncbi:MAG: hypothetical protein NXI26_21800 [bacterium]|nr:hypothetical protein [bacterium]